MQRYRLTEEIAEQAFELYRRRMICKLLRKERLLSHNTDLVLRLADRLLNSYSYRGPGRQ
jgi:hypothetical protein